MTNDELYLTIMLNKVHPSFSVDAQFEFQKSQSYKLTSAEKRPPGEVREQNFFILPSG
jgi:hypothetical protein